MKNFSKSDLRRDVKIPSSLDKNLSEFIGICVGDGSFYNFKSNNRTVIDITGDSIEDKEYHENYIYPLVKNIFGINMTCQNYGTWIQSRIRSKAIFTFLTKEIGLPTGKKKNIEIPTVISNSNDKNVITSFIRGLADTDFCLTFQKKYRNKHYYPVLKVGLSSKKLVKQTSKFLIKLGFKVHIELNRKEYDVRTKKFYITNHLFLNGKRNLDLWMNMIGFNNPKNASKYLVWKRFGYCPPRTTLIQRKSILTNKLNPNLFYRAPDG